MPGKKQTTKGISWKAVGAILLSFFTLVGFIVNGLDFINYLREGYQQFLWLGLVVLGVVWLIILWLLFKQRNVYGLLWLAMTVLAGVVIGNGWHSYNQAREAKLVILIAKFDGPEEVYGLRNEILEKLNTDFAKDADIEIESVNDVITPDSDSGSPCAAKLGEDFQADIVIWGWYRPTENPNVTIHIENLTPRQLIPLEENTMLQPTVTLAELESFAFQQQAGKETSSLVSFLVGFLEYLAGNYTVSIESFDQAIGKLQGKEQIFENQANIYFYRANAYLFSQKYVSAIQDYDNAIRLKPELSEAHFNLGNTFLYIQKYSDAISSYTEAITINPSYLGAYVNRGIAFREQGSDENALKDYNQAISIQPTAKYTCYAYFNRGNYFKDIGQYNNAVNDYSQAINVNPDYYIAYINRGYVFEILGDLENAFVDYEKAIQINPDYPGAYVNRGALYGDLGQYDLALIDLSKAIELDSSMATSYFNRGLAYQKLGRTAEAEADFKKYEELTGEKP